MKNWTLIPAAIGVLSMVTLPTLDWSVVDRPETCDYFDEPTGECWSFEDLDGSAPDEKDPEPAREPATDTTCPIPGLDAPDGSGCMEPSTDVDEPVDEATPTPTPKKETTVQNPKLRAPMRSVPMRPSSGQQARLSLYDHLPADEAVLEAWTKPGPDPAYHRAMQDKVRRDFPLLGRALDRMAAERLGS